MWFKTLLHHLLLNAYSWLSLLRHLFDMGWKEHCMFAGCHHAAL